jgi:hypothetical protein
MSKTEEEKIEAWWDNLNDNQQDWLENKFFQTMKMVLTQ